MNYYVRKLRSLNYNKRQQHHLISSGHFVSLILQKPCLWSLSVMRIFATSNVLSTGKYYTANPKREGKWTGQGYAHDPSHVSFYFFITVDELSYTTSLTVSSILICDYRELMFYNGSL